MAEHARASRDRCSLFYHILSIASFFDVTPLDMVSFFDI